jgi:hypothetical protein
MANEFKHISAGSQLSQSEYESITAHKLDSQAVGDLIYASTTEQLSRLEIDTAGKLLQVNSGATAPEWTAAITGVTTLYNNGLILGYGASDATINFATDNNIIFKIDNTAQIKLVDGVLQPQTDSDVDLGTTSVRFKDAYVDSATVTGDVSVGDDLTLGSDSSVINMGAGNDATFTHDGTTGLTIAANPITLDSGADIVLDADGANIIFKDGGTSILDIGNSSTDVELTVSTADKNFAIKGTDGSSAITALDIDMALAGKATFNGDVVVGGDLTITGDDLVMGTNTSGMLLIADGTNFNPTAVGSLSEISSIADDDVFLAVDTSGGGLKKVARSQVVSGLATSSGIASVANDSTPELGGDLDVLTNSIVTGASNRNIKLAPHGTGLIEVRGNTNPGSIILNCESNSHGQTIKSQAHSEGVTNTLTLPAGASSTLVSLVSTDTLTNKTLTTPKIAEIDSLSSGNITLDAEANIELNADGGTITFKDDSASLGTITSSGYSGTAAVATTVTITDNESTNEDNAIIFTAGGDVDGGNIGLESDGDLIYNPSTGRLTATQLAGTLQTAAQANITSLGTLTTLTVDNVITNGTTIGHTDDTDLMTLADGLLTVAGNVTLADDKVITLADEGQLIFGDVAPSTDHKGTGVVVKMTATDGVGLMEAVYINGSGKLDEADADAVGTMPAIGVALEANASGSDAVIKVLIHGVLRDDTFNFTPGADLFIGTDDNAGLITPTAPSGSGDTVQKVGVALTADTAFLNFNTTEVLLA